MWSCCTFLLSSFLCPSCRPSFSASFLTAFDLVLLLASVWKLGTPNYRGLSIIMYLAAEMYWHTVPPWKKRTPTVNWGDITVEINFHVSDSDIHSLIPEQIFMSGGKKEKMRESTSNYSIISDRFKNTCRGIISARTVN